MPPAASRPGARGTGPTRPDGGGGPVGRGGRRAGIRLPANRRSSHWTVCSGSCPRRWTLASVGIDGRTALLAQVLAIAGDQPPAAVAQDLRQLTDRRLALGRLGGRQRVTPIDAARRGQAVLDAVRVDRHRGEARPAPGRAECGAGRSRRSPRRRTRRCAPRRSGARHTGGRRAAFGRFAARGLGWAADGGDVSGAVDGADAALRLALRRAVGHGRRRAGGRGGVSRP